MDARGVTSNHMLLSRVAQHRSPVSPPPSSSMSMSMSSPSSSLLTQSEHHAFNAFLNTLSVADVDAAASMPGAGDASAEWQMYTQLGLPIPHAEGTDALSKATKELIALHPPPRFVAPQIQQHQHQQQQQLQLQQHQHNHRPIAPAQGPSNSYAIPSALRSTVQHHHQHHHHHHVSHSPPSNAHSHTTTPRPSPSKRARTSHYSDHPSTSATATDPPHASPPSPPPQSKTTLLSAQQKKANHIQSEQKRRANIRRGYEALCETVPALQEAIRADEEGSGSGSAGGGGAGGEGSGAGRRKRAKGEDGEKLDGRAGPRSESVVLQKTIEHIQSLLDHKAALLSRLDRARMMLGPGHPLLYSDAYSSGKAPWERDWDGGKGLMDVHGEEESDEEQ